MSYRALAVLLLVVAACGSPGDVQTATSGIANGDLTTEGTQVSPPAATASEPSSTDPATVVPITTLGPIYQQVHLEATVPSLDAPATMWRLPAAPPDPARLAHWARAFGFTEDEINAASGTRIMRNTPDGQVLAIYEANGQWVFDDGPAGMYADPGSCPLPSVAAPSTIAGAAPPSLPAGQRCVDPPPEGIPDPHAVEEQARALWEMLGIDMNGLTVTVGGDEYLREVIASDALDGVAIARLRVVIGGNARLLRATGSFEAPEAAKSVPRIGVAAALDRFARQPPSAGPPTTVPASFDGVYRVTGVTAGLIAYGEQWLVPSYEVALADGRTLTLLAIDPTDIAVG